MGYDVDYVHVRLDEVTTATTNRGYCSRTTNTRRRRSCVTLLMFDCDDDDKDYEMFFAYL